MLKVLKFEVHIKLSIKPLLYSLIIKFQFKMKFKGKLSSRGLCLDLSWISLLKFDNNRCFILVFFVANRTDLFI